MKRVCVDVGGTFTDCLVLDEDSGSLQAFKAPTTPADPSVGVVHALDKAAAFYEQQPAQFVGDIDLLIHGTTLATNTLLTGTGARTGLITTKGFRDSIEMRRGRRDPRESMYNLFIPPYEPLVPRYLRFGVPERVDTTGAVLEELDEGAVRSAAQELKAQGVESVAVGFLYSYMNSAHERRAAEIVHEVMNGTPVTTSHEVMPVWREFERFSTTVVSAYVEPRVAAYLAAIEQRLLDGGFRGRLLMVLSNGLMQTAKQCLGRAVNLLNSGPAAAPAGATYLGKIVGTDNLLAVDMGGTSFDVALIPGLELQTRSDAWVGDHRVAIKMVDVKSVGSGGSSIAAIDSLGLLRVGPKSAGADPGPACFGKGEEPTVTDCNLILGYVPADYFLGGEVQLSLDRALEAVEKVAEPLGMDARQAARAVFETTNANMADLIVEVCTRQGHDVRDFTMVVGGGAGPMHGAFIADLAGIERMLVPTFSALFSAFGMFTMDVGRDFARSYFARSSQFDANKVDSLYTEMELEAVEVLDDMSVGASEISWVRTAELRYVGQFHEVEIPMPSGVVTQEVLDDAVARFHARHEELFAFAMPWLEVELLTCRLLASSAPAPFGLPQDAPVSGAPVPARTRSVSWGDDTAETPVYRADELRPGHTFAGPAIVEAELTTVAVPPGWALEVDAYRNYVLERRGDGGERS